MGLTTFPNGVSSMGMPVIGGAHTTTGSVWFVDSATGSNGNTGKDKDHPFAGIDYAVGQCTANKGDIIYVMPGHTEDIANATTIVLDVAGISIIGIGRGLDVPEITWSNNSGEIIITGEGTYIENINFKSSVTAVVTGVDVDAHYVTFQGCKWDYDASGDDFLIFLDIDGYDYTSVLNCEFRAQPATAGANDAIRLDDNEFTNISGNLFTGDFATCAILSEGKAGVTNMIINNTFYLDDTGAASNGIDINVNTTGLLAYNNICTLYGTNCDTIIDAGYFLSIENYICNAINEYGIATNPGSASA